MKTSTKYLILGMTCLLLSCQNSMDDEAAMVEENLNASKSSQSYNQFILIGKSDKLPNDIIKSVGKANGKVTAMINEIGVAVVTSDDPGFLSKASKMKGIQSVVPDVEIQGVDPEMHVEQFDGDIPSPPFTNDDDFFFDLQWGHTAIQATEAWNTGATGKGVKVFVLDSGIDAEHPDLAPNLNSDLSASFVPGEDWNVRPGSFFNHGTHVAGTIAAADNGFGVIGVAPDAEIVAVKVLSEYTGSGNWSWIIAGIIYAANNGADVINMSLGGGFPKNIGKDAAQLKNALNRATTYAFQMGSTVIAAAGNDAIDRDHDRSYTSVPADGSHVFQISATAPFGWALDPANRFLDNPVYYTNYGQSAIDLAAPGGTVEYPGNEVCQVAGLVRPCWIFDLVFSTSSGGWSWAQGTSMAAPHVAGTAALIIEKNGGSMKPAHVISALKKSADDLGKPGNDDFYGAGRVNAYNAVK